MPVFPVVFCLAMLVFVVVFLPLSGIRVKALYFRKIPSGEGPFFKQTKVKLGTCTYCQAPCDKDSDACSRDCHQNWTILHLRQQLENRQYFEGKRALKSQLVKLLEKERKKTIEERNGRRTIQ